MKDPSVSIKDFGASMVDWVLDVVARKSQHLIPHRNQAMRKQAYPLMTQANCVQIHPQSRKVSNLYSRDVTNVLDQPQRMVVRATTVQDVMRYIVVVIVMITQIVTSNTRDLFV